MSYKTEFVTLPEGRFAWCYLDQPRTVDMNNKPLDDPKYETAFYLPKTNSDPRQCKNFSTLYKLVWEVVTAAYRGDWPLKSNTGAWDLWPITDCDTDKDDLQKYPWTAGHWKIKLSGGKYPPKIYDAQNNEIARDVTGKFRPGAFKSGDYGMASVNAYEWSFGAARKGVSFGLEAIKKTQDGEAIGGGGRPAHEIFGGAPAGEALPQQPPGPYPMSFASPAPPGLPPTGGYATAGMVPSQMPPQSVYGGASPIQPGFPQPGAAYSTPAYPATGPNAQSVMPPGISTGTGSATVGYPSNMPPYPPMAPPPIGTR